MQQLQFVELDEGGRLVLTDDDGRQYAVRVDDRLRAALRPRPRQSDGPAGRSVTPRDVQAMIRAGQPAEDVAASTGWELDRVRRFEGPVVAEREHVVGLAQRAPVRASGRTDGSHTLERRVRERLQSRGVDLTAVSWDAARGEAHEPWTVIVAFMAGGRERRGAWHYDVRSRWVEALDDEARWLSEDEQSLPGGLAGHPLLGGHHGEDEAAADLMATMRERRQRRAKGRRGGSRQTAEDPSHVPGQQEMPDEVLPLEDLPYDPDTMGDPPAAHPRGSAPEAAAPVGPDEDEPLEDGAGDDAPDGDAQDEVLVEIVEEASAGDAHEAVTTAPTEPEVAPEPVSPEEAQRAVGRSPGRRRRRLRLPSLSAEQQEEQQDEPEVTYARTRHDPREVTFDEFFGMEDEEDEAPQTTYRQPDVAAHESRAAEDDPEDDPDADDPAAEVQAEEVPADEAPADEVPADADDDPLDEVPTDVEADEPPAAEATEEQPSGSDEESSAAKAAGRKGRTSVPSWDDIMFGSRPPRG
ncbi:septation protein SepH [uncultured Serinicoccus sp.]|uniref:septation protein SepH n=1 Tax=uncultured Serinicoccus sp. TaxID=735514 RepID=UPI00262B9F18|nr:septation protein SepH [uncultured Serinicoccus sp.]